MKISVITICYNAEEFIEQCLHSVIAQRYDNYEYIVIDGGSTDSTPSIIKRYDNQISYWHSKKDRGLADAFNQGVEKSTGEWLIFLNADDFFCSPNVLAQMEPHLLRYRDADVVYGEINLVQRDNQARFLQRCGGPFSILPHKLKPIIPHQAAFTSRRYFERVGGFDEHYRVAMDYEVYQRDQNLAAVFVPLCISNMRCGGISSIFEYRAVELRDAQLAHHIFPKPIIYGIYYLRRVRFFLQGDGWRDPQLMP